ncbi:hypothetical protein [Streptacidiphilus sp. EB129]|uniref:hypothetical protein n=1 Tax=Streptacidiphilus sp. EB129 TaxID=3156262 RepID=UPI0035135EC0
MRTPVSPPPPPRPRSRPTPVAVQRDVGGGEGGSGGGGGRSIPPPPYSASADNPATGSQATTSRATDDPPAYSRHDPNSTTGGFDARALSDGQVDELSHRLIGPLTRLLRTELRLDRERIGRLRDPRR